MFFRVSSRDQAHTVVRECFLHRSRARVPGHVRSWLRKIRLRVKICRRAPTTSRTRAAHRFVRTRGSVKRAFEHSIGFARDGREWRRMAREGGGEYTWFFSSTRAETKAGTASRLWWVTVVSEIHIIRCPGDADLHKHFSNSVRGR